MLVIPETFLAGFSAVQECGNIYSTKAQRTDNGDIMIHMTEHEGSDMSDPGYKQDYRRTILSKDIFEFCVENNIYPFCVFTRSDSITLKTVQQHFESKRLTILNGKHQCEWSAKETVYCLYKNMLKGKFEQYTVDGYKQCDHDIHEYDEDEVMVKPACINILV